MRRQNAGAMAADGRVVTRHGGGREPIQFRLFAQGADHRRYAAQSLINQFGLHSGLMRISFRFEPAERRVRGS